MSYIYQVIASKLAQRKHLKLFYEEKSFQHQLPRCVWLQYDLLSTNTFLYISSMCPKSSVEQILVLAQWSCIKMFGNGEIKGLPTNFPIIHYKTQQLRGLSFLVLTLGRVSRTRVHYAELYPPLPPLTELQQGALWVSAPLFLGHRSPSLIDILLMCHNTPYYNHNRVKLDTIHHCQTLKLSHFNPIETV